MNAITPISSTAVLVLTPEAEEMNRRLGMTIADGVARVDSRTIGERFEKRHSEVLRSIDLLIVRRPELALRNFAEGSYTTPQTGNQLHRRFLVDRDGFMLLGMGFTGDVAIGWKLDYIAAFNAMEEALRRHATPVIDADDNQVLRRILLAKLDEVDAERAARIAAEAKAEAERQGRLEAEEEASGYAEDFLQTSRALTVVKHRHEVASNEIARIQPKAAAYDVLAGSRGSGLISDVAKDLGVMPKALFVRLDQLSWIMRRQRGGAMASDTRKGEWIGSEYGLNKGYVEHAYRDVQVPGGIVTRRHVVVTSLGRIKLEALLTQGTLALRSRRRRG